MRFRSIFNRKILSTTVAVLLFAAASAKASVALPPGAGPIPVAGSSFAAEPFLGGTIILDKLIPFRIMSPAGALLFEGTLQNRVVRSNQTSTLHFYNRIVDTKPGLNGILGEVISRDFTTTPRLLADWRVDGLGSIAPKFVKRTAGTGALVDFSFVGGPQHGLYSGQNSKFFYLVSYAKRYSLNGKTMIRLTTGQSVVLTTAMPIP